MSKGTPMRITAHMRTGIISDPYMPIDGVLHAAMMYQTFGAEEVTVAGESPLFGGGHGSIPLERAVIGGLWFFKASFAQWDEPYVDDRSFWVKRFDHDNSDLIDFGSKRPSILTASGIYKGYNTPVFLRHTLAVRWYAVGNIDKVSALLESVTHLGKKVSQGWGRVNRWEVEPWAHDWSVFRGQEVMRAIPSKDGILYGVRPPYWQPKNQTPCRLPAIADMPDAQPLA